jgi:hypothetical protein
MQRSGSPRSSCYRPTDGMSELENRAFASNCRSTSTAGRGVGARYREECSRRILGVIWQSTRKWLCYASQIVVTRSQGEGHNG